MTGGLLQLVAHGYDNIFLTDDPHITLFKIVYRRHTNFSKFERDLNFSKKLNFGTSATCAIKNYGDLLGRIHLSLDVPEIDIKFRKLTNEHLQTLLEEYDIQWGYDGSKDELVSEETYKDLVIPIIEEKILELYAKQEELNLKLDLLKFVNKMSSVDYVIKLQEFILTDNSEVTELAFFDGNNSALPSATPIYFEDTLKTTIKVSEDKTQLIFNGISEITGDNITRAINLMETENTFIRFEYWGKGYVFSYTKGDDMFDFYYLIDGINSISFTGSQIVLDVSSGSIIVNDTEITPIKLPIFPQQGQVLTYPTGRQYFDVAIDVLFIDILNVDNDFLSLYKYISAYRKDIIYQDEQSSPYSYLNLTNSDKVQKSVYAKFLNKIIGNDKQYIDDNILFYHNIGLTSFNNNTLAKNIFDDTLNMEYTDISKYEHTDSYKIYTDYFLSGTNNIVIDSQEDGNRIVSSLLGNIKWNIKKNIIQFKNFIKILENNRSYDPSTDDTTPKYFRMGYYKTFKALSGNNFDGSGEFGIVNSLNNLKLSNNFNNMLTANELASEPDDITHYFGETVNTITQQFDNKNRNIFRDNTYLKYFQNITLWKKISMSVQFPNEYKLLNNLYLMNFIPLQVVSDIHAMVKDYVEGSSIYSQYSNIITFAQSEIDSIRNQIINNMTLKIQNSNNDLMSYISEINTEFKNTNDVLLTGIFRSENLFSIYPIDDITDVQGENTTNLLPLEYVIVKFIERYNYKIRNSNIPNDAKINLKNFIKYIIDRFRVPLNNFPSYSAYMNNNFTFYKIEESDGHSTATEPMYCEAISSIWYNISNSLVTNFNNLFNESFLSENVHINLGSVMTNTFAKYKEFMQTLILQPDITNLDYYRLRISRSNDAYDPTNPNDLGYPDDPSDPNKANYNTLYYRINKQLNLFNEKISYYEKMSNLLQVRNISVNRSKNYFRSFNDIINILYNTINTNKDIYFPNDPSLQDTAITIMNNTKSELELTEKGFIDIIDILKNDLSNLYSNYNPYSEDINPNLYAWHQSFINSNVEYGENLIDKINNKFNEIIGSISRTDTSKLYSDNTIAKIYDKFSNELFAEQYLADYLLKQSNLLVFVNAIGETWNATNIAFNKIYQVQYDSVINILNYVAVPSTSTDIWKYEGSKLDNVLTNLTGTKLPKFAWASYLGYAFIDYVSVKIGGQEIDRQTGEWMYLYSQMNGKKEHERGKNIIIGNTSDMYTYDTNKKPEKHLYIPLEFWFCRHAGEFLPLVALKYTDIEIEVKLKKLEDIAQWETPVIFKEPKLKCKLLCDYYYTEEEERKIIAETKHEYLIETMQYSGDIIKSKSDIVDSDIEVKLKFPDMCKQMFWVTKFSNNVFDIQDYWNYTYDINGTNIIPVNKAKIRFNGRDRETFKDYKYYTNIQPYGSNYASLNNGMFMYNFALHPQWLQPSGAVNLTKIPELSIMLTMNPLIIEQMQNNKLTFRIGVYRTSYQVLRVMSGMAGLAFFSAD
jgi:hypothetical protein